MSPLEQLGDINTQEKFQLEHHSGFTPLCIHSCDTALFLSSK